MKRTQKAAVEELLLGCNGNIDTAAVVQALRNEFPTLTAAYVRIIRSGLTTTGRIPRKYARNGVPAGTPGMPPPAGTSDDNLATIIRFMDAVRPFGNLARVKYLCDTASELALKLGVASR